MADKTQLLKGLMDGIILKIISNEETYGYEIYSKLNAIGLTDFAEGSLYPLLLRLEKRGLIIGRKKPSLSGPDRKYYSLSEEGEKNLVQFKEAWDKISDAMNILWS